MVRVGTSPTTVYWPSIDIDLGDPPMPSSFSRFLNEDELARVREVYLESLRQEGIEDGQADPAAPEPSEADPRTDGDQP